MTGNDLIDWIRQRGAENMRVCVQYRDENGLLNGYAEIDPEIDSVENVDGEEEEFVSL